MPRAVACVRLADEVDVEALEKRIRRGTLGDVPLEEDRDAAAPRHVDRAFDPERLDIGRLRPAVIDERLRDHLVEFPALRDRSHPCTEARKAAADLAVREQGERRVDVVLPPRPSRRTAGI
uniref:Uncharacterized protein n=1 Tax=Acrobeloides nanus TaxID=290746 RepID=A0A914DB30_9BILA